MKKYLLTTVAVLLLVSSVTPLKAQDMFNKMSHIVPPDAEIANLGRFGEFKPNLATGQVDISIPLAQLKGLSLNYPISLVYDASGIQVNERATSVGLNWTFMGLGAITKTVVGLPDEETTFGFNSAYIYSNDFEGGALYTPTDFNSDKVLQAALGRYDMEPDVFSFSFNGRGGKFYYNPTTQQYYTMPYSKLMISRSTMGPGGSFEVIDEKGFKYVFGSSSNTYNFFGDTNSDKSLTYTSQWYLTAIYAPDGNLEFSFEYIEDGLIPEQQSTSQSYKYLLSGSGSCATPTNSPIMPSLGGSSSFNNVLRNGLFLSKINGPQESATFHYKERLDGSKRLDSISLRMNNVENRNWKLFQDYYQGANKLRLDSVVQYSQAQKISGYKLDYIAGSIPAINGNSQDHWGYNNGKSNSSLVPKIWYGAQYIGDANRSPDFASAKIGTLEKITYPTGGYSQFEYELNDYGSSDSPGNTEDEPIINNVSKSVNRYFSTSGAGTSSITFALEKSEVISFSTYRDQCNNRTSNCSNDPCTVEITLTGNGQTISLNGAPKQNTTILQQLQPGTYNVNVTTYEIKEYGIASFSVPQITGYSGKIATGGLRIKKITSSDSPTGQPIVKKFEYVTKAEPNRSSGTIISKPNYISQEMSGFSCSSGGSNPLPNCLSWHNIINISSNSVNELRFSDGAVVAYSRVVERIGENGEGGSTEHLFSYQEDQVTRGKPYPVNSSRSWKRGLPIKTTQLSASGDTTYKEINEYFFEPLRNLNTLKGYKVGFFKHCPHDLNSIQIIKSQMDYTSQWFYLKNNRKLAYTAGQPSVEEVTEYNYDNANHILATSVKKKLSNGNFTISRFKYPLDYSVSSGATDPAANALYKMQVKNMIDYPVEQTECNYNGTTEIVKKSSLTTYKEFVSNGIYDSKLYDFVSNSPINYTSLSSVNGNVFSFNPGYEKVFEAANYNTKGQLLEFENKAGLKKSFLYHSNGILPIAAATNAAANQIYYNGFEESTLPTMSTTSKYGKKSNNQVFVVPGTAVIAGNYTKSWWEQTGGKWVYQSVPIVHNGSDNIVFGNGGLIDNLAVYPKDAELESFDYDLSEGLLNKVKANGNGVQFQYDSMLRLKHVKDQEGNIIKSNEYHYKP